MTLTLPFDPDLPLRLARLRRDTPVGAGVAITIDPAGAEPGPVSVSVGDLATGAAFGRGPAGPPRPGGGRPQPGPWVAVRSIPDWVGPGMRVLIVGLNPSPASADAGVNFARPGNRFWPAALASGLVSADRDPEHALVVDGVGFSDLVKRTTARAAELSPAELVAGRERLERLVTWLRPAAICVLGLTGWRQAADRGAVAGWQPEPLGPAPVYLMPNPSGLNAHARPEDFVHHFHQVLEAVG